MTIPNVDTWDRDLTSEQVRRLSPALKAIRTITSLTRKVELLVRVPVDRDRGIRWIVIIESGGS